MVVHDLDVARALCSLQPLKAYSPLIVDPDTILSLAVALQCFKPAPGQIEVEKRCRCIELIKTHLCLLDKAVESLDPFSFGEGSGPLVPITQNHVGSTYRKIRDTSSVFTATLSAVNGSPLMRVDRGGFRAPLGGMSCLNQCLTFLMVACPVVHVNEYKEHIRRPLLIMPGSRVRVPPFPLITVFPFAAAIARSLTRGLARNSNSHTASEVSITTVADVRSTADHFGEATPRRGYSAISSIIWMLQIDSGARNHRHYAISCIYMRDQA